MSSTSTPSAVPAPSRIVWSTPDGSRAMTGALTVLYGRVSATAASCAAGSPMSLLGGPLATVLTTGGSIRAVSGHQRDRASRAGAEPQHALRDEIDHDRARARGHPSQGYRHRERLAGSDVAAERGAWP